MIRRDLARDTGLALRMFLVMFTLAVIYLGFLAFLWSLGAQVYTLVIFASIMLIIQYFLSDKLVLWSLKAQMVTPQQQPRLHETIERLAAQAGIPKPKIAVAQSNVPNAFATGMTQKNAIVCVTTGIMNRLEEDELEGVLGHELTHISNRDMRVITFASFFATIAAMIAQWMFYIGLFGGFGGRDREGRSSGSALMLIWLVSLLVWFVANLLIMALSRYREYAADRGGSVLTGAPGKLASALAKISSIIPRIPEDDLRKVEAANAFFFIPALKGDSIMHLLSTHPPVEKRIEKLRQLEKQMRGF